MLVMQRTWASVLLSFLILVMQCTWAAVLPLFCILVMQRTWAAAGEYVCRAGGAGCRSRAVQ